MFHRYIYFKAPESATGLIQKAWLEVSQHHDLIKRGAEYGDSKHELQRRLDCTDGVVTWMDVLSHFTSIEQLNRYHEKIDFLWERSLGDSLPDLRRHVETFETCV
jgi:hypothetical protein